MPPDPTQSAPPAAEVLVVVTGASSGMGRACVERLRDLGTTVVAVDLQAPTIEGTIGLGCDVADPDAVRAVVDEVELRGRLRALVHAAGVSPTMGDARRVLEVDLVGTELIIQAFESLVTPGTAAVCFSSSAAYTLAPFVNDEIESVVMDPLAPEFLDRAVGLVDEHSGYAYALAKVGVIRAVGRASVRWGARGGRINSVAPGLIDTPMGQQELAAQPVMRDLLASTPLSRLGHADEVASAVSFLLSDAASFVTGIDLLVDGGQIQGAIASAE